MIAMSEKERAVNEAVASFEIEGIEISDDVIELAKKLYSGEISYDEYFNQIVLTDLLSDVVFNRS